MQTLRRAVAGVVLLSAAALAITIAHVQGAPIDGWPITDRQVAAVD